jgi:hypothetical protein
MGAVAPLAPYLITAAGAGMGALNTRQTAKLQDAAAAQGVRQQGKRQQAVNARVDAELGELGRSGADSERRAAADDFMAQLQRTRGEAAGVNPALLGASGRYGADVVTQGDAATINAAKVADLMARVGAPVMQRQREGNRMAQLGTDVGIIGRAAAGDDFLTRLRMQAIRNNPWLDAAGQVAVGVGSGMASAGYGRPIAETPGTAAYARNYYDR